VKVLQLEEEPQATGSSLSQVLGGVVGGGSPGKVLFSLYPDQHLFCLSDFGSDFALEILILNRIQEGHNDLQK
jgi:hypothetical protein